MGFINYIAQKLISTKAINEKIEEIYSIKANSENLSSSLANLTEITMDSSIRIRDTQDQIQDVQVRVHDMLNQLQDIQKKLIDSVCFDTHLKNAQALRNGSIKDTYTEVNSLEKKQTETTKPANKKVKLKKEWNDAQIRISDNLRINKIIPHNVREVRIFFVGEIHLWNAIKSIAIAFQADKKYHTVIVIMEPPNYGTKEDKRKMVEDEGFETCEYNKKDIENADIVLSAPFDKVAEWMKSAKFSVVIPFVLVKKCMSMEKHIKNIEERSNDVDFVVFDRLIYEELRRSNLLRKNYVCIGNPKFDEIYHNSIIKHDLPKKWEKLSGMNKLILWTTDHVWCGGNVTFDLYAKFVFEWFEQHPDIGLIFRPHPIYFFQLLKNEIWSEHDLNKLEKYFEYSPNMVWDSIPDYSLSYSLCDAILLDANCGIIISGLVTHTPMCILKRFDSLECDIYHHEVAECMEIANSIEECIQFLNNINYGIDKKKDSREWAFENYISHFDGKNGIRIKEFIERKYLKKLHGIESIDLHIHTTASDGQYEPKDVVKMSSEMGLTTIAVTDHDTVSGIKEGRKAAHIFNLGFIPGIEISTEKNEEIHILGLYINEEYEELVECCEQYEKDRLNRGRRICDFFLRRNIPIELEDVQKIAGEGSLGRPHFARWLQDHGYVSERKEAFDKYLDTDEFHKETDRIKPSPEFAIGLIHRAGGKAVLAHPGLLKMSIEDQERLICELQTAGLDGIESFYSRHSIEQAERYFNMARKYNLKISCGSDFHGEKVKPEVKLGMSLEQQYVKELIIQEGGNK